MANFVEEEQEGCSTLPQERNNDLHAQNGSHPIERVVIVISQKERDVMNEMESQLELVSGALSAYVEARSELENEHKKKQCEIDRVFKVMHTLLSQRRKEMTNKLNEMVATQRNGLDTMSNDLQGHRESIVEGLKLQNAMISSSAKMDRKKRENALEDITRSTLRGKENGELSPQFRHIEFVEDQAAVSRFISEVGIILLRPAAPKLIVTKVTPTTATIEISTGLKDVVDVVNRIRFRKISANDDEKDVQWQDIILDQNVHLHILSGLTVNTNYAVYGEFQSLDTLVWSEQSTLFEFCTPKEIRFEWDPMKVHKDLSISNNWKRVTRTKWTKTWTAMYYRSVCSKNLLSADTISCVKWKIRMIQKGKQTALLMGFVDAEHVSEFNEEKEIGRNEHEIALDINDGYYPMRWTKTKDSAIVKDWKFRCQEGDTFELRFDFVSKECNAYYNDKHIGLLTSDLPKRLYPAISLNYVDSSFETTLFEMQ